MDCTGGQANSEGSEGLLQQLVEAGGREGSGVHLGMSFLGFATRMSLEVAFGIFFFIVFGLGLLFDGFGVCLGVSEFSPPEKVSRLQVPFSKYDVRNIWNQLLHHSFLLILFLPGFAYF